MQRQAITLAALAERRNLELATWKAARGKSSRPAVARFLDRLDENLDRLAADIVSERAPLGHAVRFTIHDPKRRTIHAACFADRVLHHAIFNLAEPRLERMLVDGCHACRRGKGVHSAVAAVQQSLRAHRCLVQVDARRLKGEPFKRLLARILACGATKGAGVGRPIGALAARDFVDGFLDSADRFLLGRRLG